MPSDRSAIALRHFPQLALRFGTNSELDSSGRQMSLEIVQISQGDPSRHIRSVMRNRSNRSYEESFG